MTSATTPGGPTDRPRTATTPSTLAGADTGGGAETASAPGSDEGLKMVVQKVREMQQGMMDLARQFPAAASSFRQAESGLRAAMRQIIANPGSPEPPAPAIGG